MKCGELKIDFTHFPSTVLLIHRWTATKVNRLRSRTASLFFSNLASVLTEKLIKADQSLYSSCNLDDDTGMFNRDAFFGCIERGINRARRFVESLALCMLEIDGREAECKANSLDAERFIFQVTRIVSDSFGKFDTIGRIDRSTLAVLIEAKYIFTCKYFSNDLADISFVNFLRCMKIITKGQILPEWMLWW